jgi:hypothetical protein
MAEQLGLLDTYQQDFDDIVAALQANGGHVDALSTKYKNDMNDMLSGGAGGLRFVINTIDERMAGTQPGADGMVLLYSQILIDELGSNPYQSHIFPAAFVNGGYDQQGYYAALLTQAAFMYANVAHLMLSPDEYQDIFNLVTRVQNDIQAWSTTFSDGVASARFHDGAPNCPTGWVCQGKGQGIGPIPDGTVLDYRNQKNPLLWTAAPVALNADPPTPTPYYCGTTAQYCYADRYDSAGHIADSRLARPSWVPLQTMIDEEHYDGLTGWRVPTTADWAALEAGATGLIFGRNVFQRPRSEALRLIERIRDLLGKY